MKKTFLIICTFILVFLMISCVTSHDYHIDKSCDDFVENPQNLQDDFNIEIGDKIYIKLCSNATTGFQWSYEMSNDTVLTEEDYGFEEPESDALGAAGKDTWTFEAVKSGSTVIFMEYSQPWEGGIQGEWLYQITVVVK